MIAVEIEARRTRRIGGYGEFCATQKSAARARLGVAQFFDGPLDGEGSSSPGTGWMAMGKASTWEGRVQLDQNSSEWEQAGWMKGGSGDRCGALSRRDPSLLKAVCRVASHCSIGSL